MEHGNDSREDLLGALEQLDETDVEALVAMIDDSPELLRSALVEYGYKEEVGRKENGLVVNEEGDGLSTAQRELSRQLDGELTTPRTVDDIVATVGAEGAAFRKQYNSAQYRSWVSDQLKSLAEAGEIGRFREGRNVHYTETPELAVRHWARLNERFAEELSAADAVKISGDVGMPPKVVRNAIRSIADD